MPSQLPYLLSGAGLLLAIYTLFRKEGREDGQTTPQRLRKLEAGAGLLETWRQGLETPQEKQAWRSALVLANKANEDAITKANSDRLLSQLENAADWERVVGILKEFNEVQRQLAVVATTSQHHSAEILRLNARQDELSKHLHEFVMRHVNKSNS